MPGLKHTLRSRALLVVVASALLGAVYFLYLKAEPRPADIIRLVPIVWLAGSIFGCIDAIRGLGSEDNRLVAGITLLLAIPSGVLACLFTMGALIGD